MEFGRCAFASGLIEAFRTDVHVVPEVGLGCVLFFARFALEVATTNAFCARTFQFLELSWFDVVNVSENESKVFRLVIIVVFIKYPIE